MCSFACIHVHFCLDIKKIEQVIFANFYTLIIIITLCLDKLLHHSQSSRLPYGALGKNFIYLIAHLFEGSRERRNTYLLALHFFFPMYWKHTKIQPSCAVIKLTNGTPCFFSFPFSVLQLIVSFLSVLNLNGASAVDREVQ